MSGGDRWKPPTLDYGVVLYMNRPADHLHVSDTVHHGAPWPGLSKSRLLGLCLWVASWPGAIGRSVVGTD